MDIKTLNDSDLLNQTKTLVSREKEITLEILRFLREIVSGRLFLARGFFLYLSFA